MFRSAIAFSKIAKGQRTTTLVVLGSISSPIAAATAAAGSRGGLRSVVMMSARVPVPVVANDGGGYGYGGTTCIVGAHHQQQQRRRWYTPMTGEEQETEKMRVSNLSAFQKETELRDLNRQIARLEVLRGINTGELYTWRGRYKGLMRDYAFPLFVYYWAVWSTMGAGVYLSIGLGGLDAMEVIGWFDGATGFNLTSRVDPTLGTIGLALVINEGLEPFRLPFVVATLKPMMEKINPPKY